MKKFFKTVAVSSALLLSTTVSSFAADATAMVFWAEWCGVCRTLDPKLDNAVASYDGDVDILRIDFTTLDFENLSRQVDKAESIGAADYVPISNVKTGYALIIIDGEIKGRISAGMSEALMHDAFDAALAN